MRYGKQNTVLTSESLRQLVKHLRYSVAMPPVMQPRLQNATGESVAP